MVSLVNYLKLQHLLCGIKLHQGSTHIQHQVVTADCTHVLFTLPWIIITQSTSCFGLPVAWVSLAFLEQRSLRSTPSLSLRSTYLLRLPSPSLSMMVQRSLWHGVGAPSWTVL